MSQDPNFSVPMKQPIKSGPKPASGTSGKAIASLILGLVSIVGMCLTGIPGLILGIMGLSDVGKSGGRLGGKGLAICGIVFSSLGILWSVVVPIVAVPVFMIGPAVEQVRGAARRTTSMNHLRQQALAMHNYESAYMKFPQDKDGLSWRVHILPFIDEGALHARFNLDEPWDSPNNKPLISEMPEYFACPGIDIAEGLTIYQVPYTETQTNPAKKDFAMFDNSGRGISWGLISDGSPNTIMIVEVNPEAAVEWTKPADWEFDPSNPMRDLGNVWPGGFNVAFADASSEFISASTPPGQFKAMITRAGGEENPRTY